MWPILSKELKSIVLSGPREALQDAVRHVVATSYWQPVSVIVESVPSNSEFIVEAP
jgi:hypothetical protein